MGISNLSFNGRDRVGAKKGPRTSIFIPRLQILGPKTGPLCDSGEHPRTDFDGFMEGEDVIGPTLAREGAMRTALALEAPADAEQGGEDSIRFCGWPLAHATMEK